MTSHIAPKSVLVTGANGGLGLATCRYLLQDGVARLVLACRTQAKADDAAAALRDAAPDAELVAVGGFDMNDQAAIEAAVRALPETSLDAVFLQAGGVVFAKEFATATWADGVVERTVSQNVLGGHVVLASLRRRGLLADQARVVVAGGEGARGIPGMIAKPSFASADDLHGYLTGDFTGRSYNPMNAIGVSKLMSALWVRALTERYDEFDAVWFTPGLTGGTKGLDGAPGLVSWFGKHVGFPIMTLVGLAQTPDQGARKYADCVLGKVGERGQILGAPEGKVLGKITDQLPMNTAFTDPALVGTIWNVAVAATGAAV